MKQIKTIKNRLDNAEQFDEAVNKALAEGWTLTRRDVLRPNAHPSCVLYAELEKQPIDKAERNCENCRYSETLGGMEPCHSCDTSMSNWELMP